MGKKEGVGMGGTGCKGREAEEAELEVKEMSKAGSR